MHIELFIVVQHHAELTLSDQGVSPLTKNPVSELGWWQSWFQTNLVVSTLLSPCFAHGFLAVTWLAQDRHGGLQTFWLEIQQP